MLAGGGESTKYIYNGIAPHFEIKKVLIADSVSVNKLIKNRIKRLGYFKVINQLLFQAIVSKIIKSKSKKLIESRKKILCLDNTPIPSEKIIEVGFINSNKCIEVIISMDPDLIIVNGTSIISKKVLGCTNALFINTHVGITPEYRGVHGGYWALRNHDKKNFGVTVHKIDKGIDTGDIIYQNTCGVEKEDNFSTYPLYQYSLAIPLLVKAITDIKDGHLEIYQKEGAESKLYYHPTLTEYIYGRVKYGIK